ncbi:MAG: CHAT domain-containing protein [Saprospiraceae bacterium]|nr:CHAT domain-containing protein [Saprospiraceae bacterium]
MKNIFLLSFIILLAFIIKGHTQDVLLFPESEAPQISKIPVNTCLSSCTKIIEAHSTDDSELGKLRSYGIELLNQGKHLYAKDVFDQLLVLTAEAHGRESAQYAQALVEMARAYVLLIRYNQASNTFKEALHVIKKHYGEDSWEYVVILNEAGMVHSRINDPKSWERDEQKCIDILTKMGKVNSPAMAIPLNNLAAAQKVQKRYDEALKNYERAFQLSKGDLKIETRIAANISEVYALTGQKQKAKKLLAKYFKIAEANYLTDNLVYSRIWLEFGMAYILIQDFEQAEQSLKYAFATNSMTYSEVRSIPDQIDDLMFNNQYMATCGQAGVMTKSAYLYLEKYKKTGDIQSLKDGHKIIATLVRFGSQLLNSYSSDEDKLTLFRLGASYAFAMNTYAAYEMYQHTKDKKYIAEMFTLAEHSKSIVLLSALQSKEDRTFGNLPPALIKKEKELQAELQVAKKEYAQAFNEDKRAEALQKLNKTNRTIDQFKEQMKLEYPVYYGHHYQLGGLDIESVQQDIEKGALLIEYTVGTQGAYLIYISREEFGVERLDITEDEMALQTKRLRKTLSDYNFNNKYEDKSDQYFVESTTYFYDKFLRPVLSKTKKYEKLLIVPDDELGYLPFEVFLSKPPSDLKNYADYPYLIKDYAINYVYSAALLHQQKEYRAKAKKANKKGMLAYAAEYDLTEPSLATADLSRMRGANLANLRKTLQPLPGAEKEVALLGKHLYGEFYDGINATEKSFKERAGDYEIIHLAMHGLLNSKKPILSSLVFSENGKSEEDNFLHAYEIAQLDLNAKLVVLSACETGYGKFRQGEGVMSLAYAFTYAGASSMLVSLWQVNDYSTGKIMKDFYLNIAKYKPKDIALREAKLAYLEKMEGKKAAHPSYWAAFIQMGDNEPLDLIAKSGLTVRQTVLICILSGFLSLLGFAWLAKWYIKRKNAKKATEA